MAKESTPGKQVQTPDKPKAALAQGDFIPSNKFTGSKPGYVFKKDKKGLGYGARALDPRPASLYCVHGATR